MELLDLQLKAGELSGKHENAVIAHSNDHVIRMSRTDPPSV
jgi:hypothetical protein